MADTTTTTTTTTAPLSDKDKLDQFFAKWGSTNKPFDESNKEDSFFREVYHSLQTLNKTLPTLYSYLMDNMANKGDIGAGTGLEPKLLPATVYDLNNLDETGVFVVPRQQQQQIAHKPGYSSNVPFVLISLVVKGATADGGTFQIANDGSNIYFRHSSDNITWSNWVPSGVSMDTVNTAISTAVDNAKISLVADEATATSNSAANPTAWYAWPEA